MKTVGDLVIGVNVKLWASFLALRDSELEG